MQVAKWGSSLAVRLPVALHAELLPVSGTRLSSLDQGRRKPEGRSLSRHEPGRAVAGKDTGRPLCPADAAAFHTIRCLDVANSGVFYKISDQS